MITYNNLYLDIRRRLRQAGWPGAGLEARELVCYGSGKAREAFFRDAQLYVPPEVERAVGALVDRHLQGEPVAYIIGEWEFYGLTLDINRSVLIPRVDTEVLAQEAIAYINVLGPCRVLDLCAGSGCVGLAAAANAPECRVLLGDLSEEAVKVCRQNVRRCALSERAAVMVLDALEPPPAELGKFDCILCNPPYIPAGDIPGLERSVRDFEPRLALCGGRDGYDFYRAVTSRWKRALKPGGRLYYEVGAGQADTVLRLMRSEGFRDAGAVLDGQEIPRVVYGTLTDSV